ncbi:MULTISPECIES: hypothetical protein [Kitasatospora]|uniref:hypothetical protein n=1 Tax=Kitasatospora TaxID=2063 RepID=UPI000C707913|nr:hypothetical protein [Kitasatospora sp. GP30]MDH6142024.1 hypothetical protein [Kitasatospora sp. GP30]
MVDASSGPDGVLLHSTDAGSWAWAGLRLAPAQGLAEHRGYADVTEEQRIAEAVRAELAWLQRQCRPGEASRLDLRYLSEPGSGLLRCVLLGQVAAATPAAAHTAALALRERLAALPGHVAARPITDQAELLAVLNPPLAPVAASTAGPAAAHGAGPGAAGPATGPATIEAAEVRPRLTALALQRPDTDRRYAVLAADLEPSSVSWEPLWAALAGADQPVVLSVALEPVQLGPAEIAELARYAAEYRRLATPGHTAPPWPQVLPGDPAAARAAAALEAALPRLSAPAFRLRATLLGTGPAVPAGLLAGAAGAVALPVPPAELPVVHANVAGLNLTPLPATHHQGLPAGHYGWVEQTVSSLAAPERAVALLRLPYQVPTHRRLFDDRFLAAAAPAAGGGPAPAPTSPEPHLPAF